ncbi:MAG: hypothetical protein MJZ71_03355 [Bacteroidales bacterium]|nr:hypothetical protein [Bacteroidales bacterium]
MVINEIKLLFNTNFVGQEELKPFLDIIAGNAYDIPECPIIYSDSELKKAAEEGYILILGINQINGRNLDLYYLREVFGVDPDKSGPCFYNQDWYMKEDFMARSLELQWYLIKKDVFEDSRTVMPADLMQRGLNFPTAILCAYTFFAYYYATGKILWYHDFIWCSDIDHNGDRIYVGKYHDIDGINKNGFSIHRHLSLRPCYASINYK